MTQPSETSPADPAVRPGQAAPRSDPAGSGAARGPTARDAAKEETRQRLIAAAIDLFAEQGLTGPSLDAIAARAGFTRGAFYVHFDTRDDLIAAAMAQVINSFMDLVIASGDAGLDLDRTIDLFVTAVATGTFPFRDSIRSHQFYEACMRSEKLRAEYVRVVRSGMTRVAAVVRQGQSAGAVRPDVAPDNLAAILVAIVVGLQPLKEVDVPFDLTGAAEDLKRLLRT